MKELQELDWFDEKWATEVRDATRSLVRLYAEAIETIENLPWSVQMVWLSGLRSSMRPYIIFKALLRDTAVEHIRRVLQATMPLQLRAYAAAKPYAPEVSLGIKKTADPARVAEATAVRDAFLAKQAKISAMLQEASHDIKDLLEILGTEEGAGQRGFKALIRAARRFLPFLWAGIVLSKFGELSNYSPLQAAAFMVGALVLYHLLAWLTLPFHDAAERKYDYFDGYSGDGSDGLAPLFPPASRYEAALFKLFGKRPPVVLSWETIVPLIHYGLFSVLLVVMLIKLPFGGDTKQIVTVFVLLLIWRYLRQIYMLRKLLCIRYRGRSAWEIAAALFASLNALVPSQEESGAGDSGGSDASD